MGFEKTLPLLHDEGTSDKGQLETAHERKGLI